MQKHQKLYLLIAVLLMMSILLSALIVAVGNDKAAFYNGRDGTYINPDAGVPLSSVFRQNRGRIPILMYHNIITPHNKARFAHIPKKNKRYFVTSDEFRRQLQTLYARGFRPISLREYLSFMKGDDNSLKRLAPGTRPFVLTFDDATYGQFDYIGKDKNGKPMIDPNCAVGIMTTFAAAHPDFKLNAAFSIDFQNTPFFVASEVGEKLNQLLDMGFTLVNHTANHLNLSKESAKPAVINYEIGRAMELFSSYLGYRANSIDIVCYPGGYENPAVMRQIKEIHYNGKTYRFKAALDAEGYQAYLPNSQKFNPYRIPRIELNNKTFKRYVLSAHDLYRTPLLKKRHTHKVTFSVLKNKITENI